MASGRRVLAHPAPRNPARVDRIDDSTPDKRLPAGRAGSHKTGLCSAQAHGARRLPIYRNSERRTRGHARRCSRAGQISIHASTVHARCRTGPRPRRGLPFDSCDHVHFRLRSQHRLVPNSACRTSDRKLFSCAASSLRNIARRLPQDTSRFGTSSRRRGAVVLAGAPTCDAPASVDCQNQIGRLLATGSSGGSLRSQRL